MALRNEDWTIVILLVLSIVVSGVMLATDDVLWEFAPTHAYAVFVFIAIFIILIGLIFLKPALGRLTTMVWSVLLLLAMLVDPLTANYPDYFTGEPWFGGLTVWEAFVYLWTQQPLFTFPILFALVVLTLVAAWRARRAAIGQPHVSSMES